MKIARGKLRNAIPCLLSLSPKDPNNRLRRLDLCLARRLRRLSCTVHFVFAKSYWFTLGFNDLLYRWERAPKRTKISQKCCSHCRNIGRHCGEFHSRELLRARTSAFYLPFCRSAIHLRVFLPLPARPLGLCLGSLWIHHRHRWGSCGIGAEPST